MLRNTDGDNFLQLMDDMWKRDAEIDSSFFNRGKNPLTRDQLQAQVDWLNTWEQLKDTAIPMRFYEQFSKNLDINPAADQKKPFWKRFIRK